MFLSTDDGLTSQRDKLVDSPHSPETPTSTDRLGMFELVAYQLIWLLHKGSLLQSQELQHLLVRKWTQRPLRITIVMSNGTIYMCIV